MRKPDYNYQDIEESLRKIGIKAGDTVFLHCNLGFFGRLEGACSSDDLCEAFYNALKSVLTQEGTLVVPCFSYSFCHNEVYDRKTTKSDCGMFTEFVRLQKDTIRSFDPNFSIAAWGKFAKYYTDNPPHESFGSQSFWARILEKKGKLLCMNIDCGSTFMHFVECQNKVPYRYNKAFNGTYIDDNGNKKRDYFVHFVYDLEHPEDGPYTVRLDNKCRNSEFCHLTNLGKGVMLSIAFDDYYRFITETLAKEPRFLTVGG